MQRKQHQFCNRTIIGHRYPWGKNCSTHTMAGSGPSITLQLAPPWRHAGQLAQYPPAILFIQPPTHMDLMPGSQTPPAWPA